MLLLTFSFKFSISALADKMVRQKIDMRFFLREKEIALVKVSVGVYQFI